MSVIRISRFSVSPKLKWTVPFVGLGKKLNSVSLVAPLIEVAKPTHVVEVEIQFELSVTVTV